MDNNLHNVEYNTVIVLCMSCITIIRVYLNLNSKAEIKKWLIIGPSVLFEVSFMTVYFIFPFF